MRKGAYPVSASDPIVEGAQRLAQAKRRAELCNALEVLALGALFVGTLLAPTGRALVAMALGALVCNVYLFVLMARIRRGARARGRGEFGP